MIANPQWWYALAAWIDRKAQQAIVGCLNIANMLDGTIKPEDLK